MKKAVFLDRDGTINEDVGHITDPQMFELIPGSIDAMNRLRVAGYILPLITNQAGVGRGLMTEQHLQTVLYAFVRLIEAAGTKVDGVYYCPHHPEEGIGVYKQECGCRKPAPGMLEKATEDLGIDLSVSYMVGDHWTDVLAGNAAGCRSILLRTGHGPREIAKLTEEELSVAAYIADDLAEAVDWILEQEG
ncbi:MAG: D-glycero-beta-D-manno-heptose-1,7-bisphosphate 7-phosphatase [Gemmatimonadetes bacterium]|nr:D-glycero-beta-D-manno-heptose-1,7-bisphosphate 7-phosphatase [Gemmatimonadota bacterium]|tara:strand:- start:641 stop:1213 length:573 start_codon:yes stop_codon:yes gene_type:complete